MINNIHLKHFFNIPNHYSVILASFNPKVIVLSHFSKHFYSYLFDMDLINLKKKMALINFKKSWFCPALECDKKKSYSEKTGV